MYPKTPFVAHCAERELINLAPNKEIILIRITDKSGTLPPGQDYEEVGTAKFKRNVSIPIEVFDMRGEFTPCDNQAERIGRTLYRIFKETPPTAGVIFQCRMGEIRSAILAGAMARLLNFTPASIQKGKVVGPVYASGTFATRTLHGVRRTYLTLKSKEEEKI